MLSRKLFRPVFNVQFARVVFSFNCEFFVGHCDEVCNPFFSRIIFANFNTILYLLLFWIYFYECMYIFLRFFLIILNRPRSAMKLGPCGYIDNVVIHFFYIMPINFPSAIAEIYALIVNCIFYLRFSRYSTYFIFS